MVGTPINVMKQITSDYPRLNCKVCEFHDHFSHMNSFLFLIFKNTKNRSFIMSVLLLEFNLVTGMLQGGEILEIFGSIQ